MGTIELAEGKIVMSGEAEDKKIVLERVVAGIRVEGLFVRKGKIEGDGIAELISPKEDVDEEYFTLLIEALKGRQFLVEECSG